MSSDFCIKCDKELSVYCGPCMDEARAEVERLRERREQRDEAAAVLRKARTLLPQLREQLSEFAYQELTSLLDDPFEWEGDK